MITRRKTKIKKSKIKKNCASEKIFLVTRKLKRVYEDGEIKKKYTTQKWLVELRNVLLER